MNPQKNRYCEMNYPAASRGVIHLNQFLLNKAESLASPTPFK
ncbi:MAG: hypothetical protein DID92_2727743084 [Candidatus Nitrotoga sp. SPKER]|nr:MAG: hypothetical protein DID92_2727743084 [Candidatus Nitrotoga sp. SPKER]